MTLLKTFTAAAIAAGTLVVATAPAQAVITTFASYSPIGTGANVYWKNNGSNGSSNGTGGSIYTIATNGSAVPGSRLVKFSFLQPQLSGIVNSVNAKFTLSASVTNTPAMLAGGFLLQENVKGSFSFLSTAPIVVNNTTYAAGSNLLTGVFGSATPGDAATIFGQRNGSSGSFSGSTTGGTTVTYTSDFLDFFPTVDRDFSISLTSIIGALQAIPSTGIPNKALRTFRAVSSGTFSTDPAPIVTAVPEPAVWGLMIVGFGMVGLQTRRRARGTSVVA